MLHGGWQRGKRLQQRVDVTDCAWQRAPKASNGACAREYTRVVEKCSQRTAQATKDRLNDEYLGRGGKVVTRGGLDSRTTSVGEPGQHTTAATAAATSGIFSVCRLIQLEQEVGSHHARACRQEQLFFGPRFQHLYQWRGVTSNTKTYSLL